MDFSQFLKRGATITPLLQEAQFDANSLQDNRSFLSRWAWDDGRVAIVTLWVDELEGTSVPFKRFVNPAHRPELKGNRRVQAEEVYATLAKNTGKAIRVLLQLKRSDPSKRASGLAEARGLDSEPWYVAADPKGLRLQRSIRPGPDSQARPQDADGMRLLVCNIGWMDRYRGLEKGDQISGQFSYLQEHGMGHEICNFLPDGDIQFGYVQATHQIKLEKLGADPEDSELSGVTVIWTAKRPKGGTVVVGWYRNATVYRHFQPLPTINGERRAHNIETFNVSAATKDTSLLSIIDERTLEVPRGAGGMGQSPIWYANSAEASEFRRQIAELIQSGRQVARGPARGRQDQLKKVEVERAAVDCVWAHFANLGYELKSVEKDNVGWDLEARQGAIVLKIEVKGLSATSEVVELTPNEYKVWEAAPPEYRLAIVSDALRHPRMTICRHSAEQGSWVTDTPQKAVFVEIRPAARIRIGSST